LSELYNINHFIVSQVNPHTIPFLQDLRYSGSTTERWVDLVWRKCKVILSSEFKHRLRQAMEIGLIPHSNALLQDYTGDVTIVPDFSPWDYTRLVSNPSEDFRAICTQKGEHSTWPCMVVMVVVNEQRLLTLLLMLMLMLVVASIDDTVLSMLKVRCSIEHCLEECIQNIRDRMALQLPSRHHQVYALQHKLTPETPQTAHQEATPEMMMVVDLPQHAVLPHELL
jgi:hypothetical protein